MPAETAEAVTGTAGEDEAPAMPAEPADTAQAGEDPAVPDTPAAEGAVESGAAPPANAGDAPEAAEAPMEAAPDAPEAGDTVTAAMDSDAPDTASAPDMPPADSDPKAPAAEPMISAITVQPGSTLWAISRERYGDGLLYVQVFEANRDKIRDPDLIYPGQVFELPADVSGN
jgi:nucleoid-associated protein YgaU